MKRTGRSDSYDYDTRPTWITKREMTGIGLVVFDFPFSFRLLKQNQQQDGFCSALNALRLGPK
ncbi:MAG TPA: hypothetical protein DCZ04_08890 [Syntrophorhabdus aromaticivorans]|nr:hypothetical protein [Syntrophorhabdus aromaticivorans]